MALALGGLAACRAAGLRSLALQDRTLAAEQVHSGTMAGAGRRDFAARLGEHRTVLLYIVLSVVAVAPVFMVDIVPLAGFLNHMARVHVLANIAGDPVLQSNYRLNWAIMPNLGLDVVLPQLSRIIPLFDLGRLFVAVTMLTLVGGSVALHRVLHGRVGPWPAAAYLFLYNQALILGFLNFLFGLGLCLCALAAWIALRDRPAWQRIALFSVVTTVLFFTHLMALGIYGLLLGAWEFSRALRAPRDWRRIAAEWAAGAAQFVAPAVLLLIALPAAPVESAIIYGGPLVKLRSFWSPVLAYVDPIDGLTLLFVVGTALFAFATRRLAVARNMGLALALLAVLAFALPFKTFGRFGGVWGLDARFFIVLAFVAVAAIDFRARTMRVAVLLGVSALFLFGARVWEIAGDWRAYDAQYAEYRRAAEIIEPGARILPVQETAGPIAGDSNSFPFSYWYITVLSTVDRGAFTPVFYTDPVKQPVIAAPRNADIDTPVGVPAPAHELRDLADLSSFVWYRDDPGLIGVRLYAYLWQNRFDYVVATHAGRGENPAPGLLVPVAHGSFFDIYRIVDGGCLQDDPRVCAIKSEPNNDR